MTSEESITMVDHSFHMIRAGVHTLIGSLLISLSVVAIIGFAEPIAAFGLLVGGWFFRAGIIGFLVGDKNA